jgi:hypothetical protein
MDNVEETCHICQEKNDSVFDGMCETCEPIWFDQIRILSKNLDENTRLADLFEQAAKAAKEEITKSKQTSP